MSPDSLHKSGSPITYILHYFWLYILHYWKPCRIRKLLKSKGNLQVMRESSMNTQTGDRPFFDFLESSLRHKSEMVILEAARKITEMDVTSRELAPAITVLQLFLSSSKPVLRFAAVRTLNKVIHICFSSLAVQRYFCTISLLICSLYCRLPWHALWRWQTAMWTWRVWCQTRTGV